MQAGARLSLAKASTGGLKMPDGEAIKKSFSVSTNLEVAEYFRDQLAARAKSCGLSDPDSFNGVMHEVNKFVDIIRTQTSTDSKYWSGAAKDAAVSLYKTFHQNLSSEAMKALETKFPGTEINFDFAMNNQSELLQGFATPHDGKPLGEAETAQMNEVYSAWLVEKGYICDDGVIYEASKDGTIQTGKEGGKKPVNPEVYREQIMNKNEGIADFVAKKTNSKVTFVVNDVSDTVFPEAAASQGTQTT